MPNFAFLKNVHLDKFSKWSPVLSKNIVVGSGITLSNDLNTAQTMDLDQGG